MCWTKFLTKHLPDNTPTSDARSNRRSGLKMRPEERERLAEKAKSLVTMAEAVSATVAYLTPRLREALRLE